MKYSRKYKKNYKKSKKMKGGLQQGDVGYDKLIQELQTEIAKGTSQDNQKLQQLNEILFNQNIRAYYPEENRINITEEEEKEMQKSQESQEPEKLFTFGVQNCDYESKYRLTLENCLTIERINKNDKNNVQKIYLSRGNSGNYNIKYKQGTIPKEQAKISNLLNAISLINHLLFYNEINIEKTKKLDSLNEKLANEMESYLKENPKIFQRIQQELFKGKGGNKRKTRKLNKSRKQRKTNKRRKSYRK